MPSLLPCSCGKTLKIPDGIAPGTRVKCKNCNSVLVVPGAAAKSAGATATRPGAPKPTGKPTPPAKPVAKKPIPPPADDDEEEMEEPVAPRKASAKPTAKKPIREEEDEDEIEERVSAKPTRGGSKKPLLNDDDESDEDDDAPRSKSGKRGQAPKKKSSLLPILIASVAGLLVIGGGVVAFLMFFSGPSAPVAKNRPAMPPPGMGGMPPPVATDDGWGQMAAKASNELPANTMGFVQFRVQDWWNGPSGKQFQASKQGQALEMMKEKLTFTGADIDFFRIAIPGSDQLDPKSFEPKFGVVVFLKDMDWDKVREGNPTAGPKQMKGDKSYFATKVDEKDAPLAVPLNARVVALIDVKVLDEFMEGKMEFNGNHAEKIKEAANHHVFASADLPPVLLEPLFKLVGGQKDHEPIKDAKSATLKLRDGSPFQIEVQVAFGQDSSAQAMQKTLEGLSGFAAFALGNLANQPGKKQDPQQQMMANAGGELLKNLKITANGPVLQASTSANVTLGGVLPTLIDQFPVGGPPMPKGKNE